MAERLAGLGIAAAIVGTSLAAAAGICVAVSWWVMADPWAIFVILAHSYHSGVRRG
jgi:hypothetical protein